MHNFQIIGKVGEGAFACVYKVKRKEDGQIYAMKRIKMGGGSKEMVNCLNEVRILASMSSPYIIAYKEAVYDQSAGTLLLITEFAEGGDLSGYIRAHQKRKELIEEGEIWRMAIQMLHGLKTLHNMSVFHRDIKSANVLLSKKNQQVKLGDLNVSKISKSGLAVTQTGTPYYASPEVWSDLPYNGKCDIWSLGCVLYQMASFRPPFAAPDIHSLRKKIMVGHFDRIPSHYSQELEQLIRMCLTVNPKERPSAQGLLHCNLIRKRLYLFPNEKFNEQSYDMIQRKESKLLQTIRIPGKYNFGSQLKNRLPKSNYQNQSVVVRCDTQRHQKSLSLSHNRSQIRLPELVKKNTTKQSTGREKCNVPRPRLVYLR